MPGLVVIFLREVVPSTGAIFMFFGWFFCTVGRLL